MKKTFGKVIREIRKGAGLSQEDLQKESGIKREYICKIENDELRNPTLNTGQRIAEALGLRLSEIIKAMEGADIPDAPPKYRQPQIDPRLMRELDKNIAALIDLNVTLSAIRDSLVSEGGGE